MAADVVRLGPASYSLPADALRVSIRVEQRPDGDPSYDYYGVSVRISNGVSDPSIRPFRMSVRFEFDSGVIIGGHYPPAGDYERQSQVFTLQLPAGKVDTAQVLVDPGWFQWTVSGERGLRRQPIFDDGADFSIEMVRLTEGDGLGGVVTATVDWYYSNLLQAYPIASSTVIAGVQGQV